MFSRPLGGMGSSEYGMVGLRLETRKRSTHNLAIPKEERHGDVGIRSPRKVVQVARLE